MDDAECSELCTCGESLTLTCHALCVPFAPCRTALAFYSHASPAYQAFRGRCLCYSGRFICMKPPLGDYSLPGKYSSSSWVATLQQPLLRKSFLFLCFVWGLLLMFLLFLGVWVKYNCWLFYSFVLLFSVCFLFYRHLSVSCVLYY